MEEIREEPRPVKNKIDKKSLDDQLQQYLDKAYEIEKKKKNDAQEYHKVRESVGATEIREIQEWEIDPEKLDIHKEPFAHGTYGHVHKGVYDGKPVAVKVLDWGNEGERKKALRRDFQREVSVWFKLDHPNITKCIGATTMMTTKLMLQIDNKEMNSNCACVITEYLSRGTLKSYLIRQRKQHVEDFLQLALDLARGLSYLHSKNIVHRDVKTENLLLDKNRVVKIADFGVARLQASNLCEMTGNTGTPAYMAPEVLESKPYDEKCDVYSFGICLWEIYCCQMPYSDYSISEFSELTSAIVYKKLRPEIPKGCPRSLAKVMKRCWDAEPSKRPQMEEVVTMLEEVDYSKHPHGCFCFSMPSTK